MIKLKSLIGKIRESISETLTIYQGRSVYNKNSKYFTTNKEWAQQFTQSGRENEITIAQIDPKVIYGDAPLPQATNEKMLEKTIEVAKAKNKDYKAIWVDEGIREPRSIFILDWSAVKIVKPSIIKENIDKTDSMQNQVKQLEHELETRFPEIDILDMYIRSSGDLYISHFRIKKDNEVNHRGKGIGGKIMNEIIKFADENGLYVTLHAAAEPRYKEKLYQFYKRFGFFNNKGRNILYQYSTPFGMNMIRRPQK